MSDALINALESIAENGPPHELDGICGNVESVLGRYLTKEEYYLLRDCFGSWKHFSGVGRLPVEGQHLKYVRNSLKWDQNTDYGWLRWDLLAHCIEELSK